MPLTRRVQVFISEAASAALDRLTADGREITATIEVAILFLDGAELPDSQPAIKRPEHTTEPPDDNTNSLSPESKQARDEKKEARRARKAELSDTISKALPLKRDKIVSIPKPGKNK